MDQERGPIIVSRTSRLCLRVSCLWPSEDEQMRMGKKFWVQFVIVLLVPATYMLTLVISHTIMVFKAGVNVSEDIAVLAAFVGNTGMFYFYLRNQRKLAMLLMDLSNFDEFGKPSTFEALNNKMDYYTKNLFIYAILVCFYNSFTKMANRSKCKERGLHENCGFAVPSSTPYDISPDHPLIFGAHFTIELIFIHVLAKVALMTSYHLFEICQHIILRIQHLNTMLSECFDENSRANRVRLNNCLAYHNQIIGFATRLDESFVQVMFTHFATTGFVCGCLENYMVKEFHIACLLHFSGWIAALFLVCLGGQQLWDASLSVAEVAYNSKWYEADPTLQKDIMLMIMRSQKPLLIRAGSFGIMSFPLFVTIMKASYSIVTLLN